MVDFLGVPLSIVNVTGWGMFVLLALAIVRAFIKGDIRTAREVSELRADRDERIEEAGKWEAAFTERGTTIKDLLRQNEMLLREFGTTATKALDAIPHEQEGVKGQ